MEEQKLRYNEHSSTPEKILYNDRFFSHSPKSALLLENKLGEMNLSKQIWDLKEELEEEKIEETSIPDEDEIFEN